MASIWHFQRKFLKKSIDKLLEIAFHWRHVAPFPDRFILCVIDAPEGILSFTSIAPFLLELSRIFDRAPVNDGLKRQPIIQNSDSPAAVWIASCTQSQLPKYYFSHSNFKGTCPRSCSHILHQKHCRFPIDWSFLWWGANGCHRDRHQLEHSYNPCWVLGKIKSKYVRTRRRSIATFQYHLKYS